MKDRLQISILKLLFNRPACLQQCYPQIIVLDEQKDERLRTLTEAAVRLSDHSLRSSGAVACAQASSLQRN